ncbi:hypothetical protein KIM322_13940 [Lactobacillus xylocopicola]|uniref:CAAX prenyl protease 2/Lysostaphin resistance protein A-like domain-containing protein n=1 Tax=Lactobacillus xylocopicola TaxID=2976676 RepID=A0ABM8BIJ7_9LACO|nr:hypothetical protein KIM322_13940 [Lactobacillus xylocopicola]
MRAIIIIMMVVIAIVVTNAHNSYEIGLLVAAVLEEIIYREIGISYLPIILNNVLMSIIIITIIFLLNHSFIILSSKNKLFSFSILFILNIILIITRFNIGFIPCVFLHLFYDAVVIKQNKFY